MGKNEKQPREYRGVNDEIREQQRKMKDMSWKGKFQYFWDYYRYHTLAAVFITIMAVSLIRNIVMAKDYIFNAIMLNAYNLSSQSLSDTFAEYAGLDTETYECFIDTTTSMSLDNHSEYEVANGQRIVAMVQTQDLDAVVFDSEMFNNYSYNQMFFDLREIFTEEELSKYEDKLYYIEYAEIRKMNEQHDYICPELITPYDDRTPESIAAEAEKHRHPENFKEPIPVGIYLADSPFVVKSNSYFHVTPIFGIICNSQRVEVAKQYLEFLWDDTVDFSQMGNTEMVW